MPLLSASAATAAAPAKKVTTPAQRLNTAEQLEMLAERLTRSWAMKGNDSLRPRATTDFDEDSRRFSRQLKALQADADTPALKDAYAALELVWTKYSSVAETSVAQLRNGDLRSDPNSDLPPTAFVGAPQNQARVQIARVTLLGGAKDIADQNDKLVAAAAKASDLIRQKIGAESEGMHLAAQARMLSQRMSRLYFFRSLGMPEAPIAVEMKKAEAAYLQSIRRLRELSEDRPRSVGVLSLVDQQWMFFSEITHRTTTVEREDRDQIYQTFVRTSDSLLSGLEDLCRTFEQ